MSDNRLPSDFPVCEKCKGSGNEPNTYAEPCSQCHGCGHDYLEKNEKPYEFVNHPTHYGGDTTYETIKVLRAWGLTDNFCLGNCVKYLSRCGKKPGESILKDLKKVAWYLQNEIESIESREKKNVSS